MENNNDVVENKNDVVENKNNKLKIVFIVVLSIVLVVLIVFAVRMIGSRGMNGKNPFDEDNSNETTGDQIDSGSMVNGKVINLDEYDTNITISEGGEYNISGTFNYSILVDAPEKVILNLNGVNIDSTVTAAIANKGNSEMVIHIVEGTTNILKDSGFSEFDGCIYSKQKMTIEGSGILRVAGNQEDGEGIATTDADITINGGEIYIESNDDGLNIGGDNGGVITINGGNIKIKASGDGIDSNGSLVINGGNVYTMGSSKGGDSGIDVDKGFEIHGGNVIAIGSDMLQNPDKTSKQNYVSFSMREVVSNGSKIVLKNGSTDVMSFTANENFKTIIFSNDKISSGTYDLYVDGEKTNYSYTIN